MSQLDDAPAAMDGKVVDLAVRKAERVGAASRLRMPAAWKPLAGFAAAASMGAAAVFFLQPQSGGDASGGEQPVRGIPVAGTLAHWKQQPGVVQPVALTSDEAHNQMLQEYLMDHSSAVAGEGFGSTLRYARFAAHTADYRNGSGE